jgi:hypothetical protein
MDGVLDAAANYSFSMRRGLNSPINAHHVNLQGRSSSYLPFAGVSQLFCVCVRDKFFLANGYLEIEISVAQRPQQ